MWIVPAVLAWGVAVFLKVWDFMAKKKVTKQYQGHGGMQGAMLQHLERLLQDCDVYVRDMSLDQSYSPLLNTTTFGSSTNQYMQGMMGPLEVRMTFLVSPSPDTHGKDDLARVFGGGGIDPIEKAALLVALEQMDEQCVVVRKSDINSKKSVVVETEKDDQGILHTVRLK